MTVQESDYRNDLDTCSRFIHSLLVKSLRPTFGVYLKKYLTHCVSDVYHFIISLLSLAIIASSSSTFIKQYSIGLSNNLFFHMFFRNSLRCYLHNIILPYLRIKLRLFSHVFI